MNLNDLVKQMRMNDFDKSEQINLGKAMSILVKLPKDKVFKIGLGEPHSYRGYYDELAFEPKADVSVDEMIKNCEDALKRPFYGYKGGTYEMDCSTPIWLSEYGDTGSEITEDFFK